MIIWVKEGRLQNLNLDRLLTFLLAKQGCSTENNGNGTSAHRRHRCLTWAFKAVDFRTDCLKISGVIIPKTELWEPISFLREWTISIISGFWKWKARLLKEEIFGTSKYHTSQATEYYTIYISRPIRQNQKSMLLNVLSQVLFFGNPNKEGKKTPQT